MSRFLIGMISLMFAALCLLAVLVMIDLERGIDRTRVSAAEKPAAPTDPRVEDPAEDGESEPERPVEVAGPPPALSPLPTGGRGRVEVRETDKPARARIEETTDLPPKAALGLELFYDPILSSTGTVSCSTCHDPERGYSSGGLPPKLGGGVLDRKAPSLYNKAAGRSFFWDGRARSLERQVIDVISNRDEMGGDLRGAMERVNRKYGRKFLELYQRDTPVHEGVADALASFERTLKAPRTKFDDFTDGRNELVMTPQEVRGWNLFRGEAQCYRCHTGPNMTDEGFHNTGVGWDPRKRRFDDAGRSKVTGAGADYGKFKTPDLRACKLTAPYMHDASLKTLRDVVEFYNRGGNRNPNLDRDVFPLRLTEQQIRDLVAFLETL